MRGLQYALVTSLLFVTACGGHNPVAPTSTTAGATGLVITGADQILSGDPTEYTATATFSEGSTRMVAAAWTTSNPAIATVEGSGRVIGHSHGSFVLTASFAGRDVSKTVQVINNYRGRWEGQYRIAACEDTGDLSDHDGGWCRTESVPGTVRPIVIDVAQSGTSLAEVVANLWGGTYHGSVTDDGRLTLNGSNDLFDWDHEYVVAIREIRWEANLAGNAMVGHFQENLRSIVFRIGNARVEYELTPMTRAAPLAARQPSRIETAKALVKAGVFPGR